RVRPVADARRARAPPRRGRSRPGDVSRPGRAPRDADRCRATHGVCDGRLPRLRDRDCRRKRSRLPRRPGLRSWRRQIRRRRARNRRGHRLMPWRRFRKKVERPIDVSKSIEESLEDAADGESEEDATELAELDDATIAEAATGEPDDDRAPTELGEKLRGVLDEAAQRGGPLRSAPRWIALPREQG